MTRNAAERLLAVAEILASVDPELSRAASERVLRSCGGRCQPATQPPVARTNEDEARRTRLECERHAVSGSNSGSTALAGRVCRVCATVLVPGATCTLRVRRVRQLGRRAAARMLRRYRLGSASQGPQTSSLEAAAVRAANWFEGALDRSRVTKGVPAELAGASVVCARRPTTCVVLHCFRCGHCSVVALGQRPHIERPPALVRSKPPKKVTKPSAKAVAPAKPAAAPFSFKDLVSQNKGNSKSNSSSNTSRGPSKRPTPTPSPQPAVQPKRQQAQANPPPPKQRKIKNAALAFLQPKTEPETNNSGSGTGLFSFLDELRKK